MWLAEQEAGLITLLTGIRRIPADFEARIALLTGLGNGKSPRQQAIEARG
jgi:hypothetical protein